MPWLGLHGYRVSGVRPLVGSDSLGRLWHERRNPPEHLAGLRDDGWIPGASPEDVPIGRDTNAATALLRLQTPCIQDSAAPLERGCSPALGGPPYGVTPTPKPP